MLLLLVLLHLIILQFMLIHVMPLYTSYSYDYLYVFFILYFFNFCFFNLYFFIPLLLMIIYTSSSSCASFADPDLPPSDGHTATDSPWSSSSIDLEGAIE